MLLTPTDNAALHDGLEALLREAKRREITRPPFGRGPLHLPYEDYFENDIDDENPNFRFDYGFNALKFLADYLRQREQRDGDDAPAPAPVEAPSAAPVVEGECQGE